MKIALLAAVASLAIAFAAHAGSLHAPMKPAASLCDAGRSGMTRTAYSLPQGPQCCEGDLRCTQLLSTAIIDLPHPDPRT